MIPRHLLGELETALAETPAVALLGPRQVGKTTLALEWIYIDRLQIRPEEKALSARFGATYASYNAGVRRRL